MKAYLSITEIAKITQKPRSTVVRWVQAGKFEKVRKIGNEYQIPHESFKKWWSDNLTVVKTYKKQT